MFSSRASTSMPTRDIDTAILSVRLSRFGMVSKRLNVASYFLQHMVAHHSSFARTKYLCDIPTVSSPTGVLNSGVVYTFHDFQPIYVAIRGKLYKNGPTMER